MNDDECFELIVAGPIGQWLNAEEYFKAQRGRLTGPKANLCGRGVERYYALPWEKTAQGEAKLERRLVRTLDGPLHAIAQRDRAVRLLPSLQALAWAHVAGLGPRRPVAAAAAAAGSNGGVSAQQRLQQLPLLSADVAEMVSLHLLTTQAVGVYPFMQVDDAEVFFVEVKEARIDLPKTSSEATRSNCPRVRYEYCMV